MLDSELPTTIRETLQQVRKILSRSLALAEARLVDPEAEQIVSAAFRKVTGAALSRVDLHARGKESFPIQAARMAIEMAQDRSEGSILQHLTGSQEFLGHEYEVGPDVLVPRPETELLAFLALERLKRGEPPSRGWEIGLGSGILSIELLAHFSRLEMFATEVSDEARARAQSNAQRILGSSAGRLHVLSPKHGRDVWSPFESLGERADFLISNPPYLTPQDSIADDVRRHEPAHALYAPPEDALHFYREISGRADDLLKPRAWVFLEVPHERSAEIARLFEAKAWYAEILDDLTGRPRVLIARRQKEPDHG